MPTSPRRPSYPAPVNPSGSGPGRWNDAGGQGPNTQPVRVPRRPRPTAS
ncbi:hypothetical protein ACF08W_22505 [Streptomyces sp. NPDC015144]